MICYIGSSSFPLFYEKLILVMSYEFSRSSEETWKNQVANCLDQSSKNIRFDFIAFYRFHGSSINFKEISKLITN